MRERTDPNTHTVFRSSASHSRGVNPSNRIPTSAVGSTLSPIHGPSVMFGKVSFSILQRTAKLVERGLLRRDVRIIHQALSLHPAGDGRKVSNATMPEKELHLAFPRLTLSSHNMQSFCAVPFQAPPTRPAFGMRQTSPHIVWVHLAHLAYLSPLHKLVQSLAKLDGLLFGGEDLRVQVTVRRLQGVVPLPLTGGGGGGWA